MVNSVFRWQAENLFSGPEQYLEWIQYVIKIFDHVYTETQAFIFRTAVYCII